MSDKPNPFKWRENAAIANMHVSMAGRLLQSTVGKDTDNIPKLLENLGRAIESLEAAHKAACDSHNEFATLFRYYKQNKPVPISPFKTTIADLVKP